MPTSPDKTYNPNCLFPHILTKNQEHEGGYTCMKIVVIHSPGFLAPFLRRFFGIRKQKKR